MSMSGGGHNRKGRNARKQKQKKKNSNKDATGWSKLANVDASKDEANQEARQEASAAAAANDLSPTPTAQVAWNSPKSEHRPQRVERTPNRWQ